MLPLGDFGIPNSPTLRSRCNPNSNTALSCHKIDAEMQCIIMNCQQIQKRCLRGHQVNWLALFATI